MKDFIIFNIKPKKVSQKAFLEIFEIRKKILLFECSFNDLEKFFWKFERNKKFSKITFDFQRTLCLWIYISFFFEFSNSLGFLILIFFRFFRLNVHLYLEKDIFDYPMMIINLHEAQSFTEREDEF